MKKLISTVLALGMAAGLAGCGSSAAATPGSTAAAVSAENAAAADTDLAYIQGKGKMTIGYTVYEPMNYTDADGNFTGFDTELATAVCAKLGVEPDFVEINWDTKVVELDAKSIDCIWNGMTLTDDIMANAACTKPYAKNAQVVVMKADAAYASTADLAGKTVVAEAGSAGETAISEDAGLSQAEYISKSVQTDCLMEVAAGTADAAIIDSLMAGAMVGEGTSYPDLTYDSQGLTTEEYGIGCRQGSDLADFITSVLAEAYQDGTTQTLARQFGIREDLLAEMPQTGYTEDAGGDVAYIRGKGTLVVGITEFAPMDYKDDNGQWTGFDAELARLVAQRLGVDVEFVVIEWGQKVNELNSKAIDVVWNGMTLTDEVKNSMECTNPYFNNAQVVVTAGK